MMAAFLAALPGGPFLLMAWTFLTSRIGVLLLACALAFGSGYSMANRRADIARLNAQIETLKSDQTSAENARVMAEGQASDLDGRLKANTARVEALQSDLERARHQPPKVRVVTKTAPAPAARDCGLTEGQLGQLKEIQ